jgi:hypothetical protein
MVPIMMLSMHEMGVKTAMPEVYSCFEMLHHILGIFTLGPSKAMRYIPKLRKLIQDHHAAFVRLYPEKAKPKIHHLHHVPADMEWLGKLISCFVTERKHREIKRGALHVFRDSEHVVIADVLNAQCEQMSEGHDLFDEIVLLRPSEFNLANGHTVQSSKTVVCSFGELNTGDVVYLWDGHAGRIAGFWLSGESFVIRVDLYPCVNGDTHLRDETRSTVDFISEADIAGTCIWVQQQPGVIRICVPPVAFWD